MRTLLSTFLFLWLAQCYIFSQTIPVESSEVAKLLKQVEQKLPENYRFPAAYIENRSTLNSVEMSRLQSVIASQWPELLNNLDAVAPTRNQKTILLIASQELKPEEYIKLLEKTVDLAESGKIDPQLLGWALFPYSKNTRGVLEYNYDKPTVKKLLFRAKSLFHDYPSKIKYCDAVLSGVIKKNIENEYANNHPWPKSTPTDNAPNSPSVSHSESTMPHTEQTSPSTIQHNQSYSSFPIVSIGILMLVIIGLAVYLLRRK